MGQQDCSVGRLKNELQLEATYRLPCGDNHNGHMPSSNVNPHNLYAIQSEVLVLM